MSLVSWLHFSDLHVGMQNQEWLLPNFKELLFEDLRKLHERAGPWDFVIFSGDVAQKGAREEFDKATEVLDDVWKLFKTLGSTPYIIATPGNHDLVRPATNDPVLRAMLHWHDDAAVREAFWSSADNPYRQLVEGAFENFVRWRDGLPFPKAPNFSAGSLPGDCSYVIQKSGIQLGLISLNSSFLQLTNENYEEKLELDIRQFVSACGGDNVGWGAALDEILLITHHPKEWLNASGRARFESDIYPPERFFAHFCGHLHEAAALNTSAAGAGLRRVRQAPSLFGLQYWGDHQKRIHGYSAGRLSLTSSELTETIWPRLAHRGYAGHLRLVADPGYELNQNDSAIWVYPGEYRLEAPQSKETQVTPALMSTGSASRDAALFLDKELSETEARAALENVPRMHLRTEPHHRSVRRFEQATSEQHLEGGRCVWILSDWGLGTDAFIASVITSLAERSGSRDPDVFAIQCDDASTIESFRGQAHRQLGLPLQQLLGFAAVLPQCILVIENVSTDLLTDKMPDSGATFDEVIQSILDYCPQIRVVLTTRSVPATRFPFVGLKALELPEVRTYVIHHAGGGEKFAGPDAIDTLYRRSAGLPIHLDRLLESLRYITLKELIDSHDDELIDTTSEAVPRALERAVTSLARSYDRYSRRSFRLLRVLTVLADGETLQSLRHFDQADPFFPVNAAELERLQLVQVLPVADVNPNSSPEETGAWLSQAERLLIVPRQVRDYTKALIPQMEHNEIIKRAADLVFGAEWREGKLKSHYFQTAAAGQRNEAIILGDLLSDAITRSDPIERTRTERLAVTVCEGLCRSDRYRETVLIAEAVLPFMSESPSSPKSRLEVTSAQARALRMLGRREDAITIIGAVLSEGAGELSKDHKSSLFINLAFAHQLDGDTEAAVEAAKEVQKLERTGSGLYLQAEGIIAVETLTGEALINELERLEKAARASNYITAANNLTLALVRHVGSEEGSRLRERVIRCSGDNYNRIRAVIGKAKAQITAAGAASVSPQERKLLFSAYSYLHGQRMAALFDTCHEVLWQLLRAENRWAAVLRLFRHSSFFWRIYGKLPSEKEYVENLSSVDLTSLARSGMAAADLAYFERRRLESAEPLSRLTHA
jgi:hypothetical protein